MKKLFFYTNIERDNDAVGITKKVRGQIKAFKSLGYDVFYSCYIGDAVAIYNAQDEKILCECKYLIKNADFNRATRRFVLLNFAAKYLKHEKFDVVYARYHYFDSCCLKFLRSAKASAESVIIEMHSYPCLGGRGIKNKVFMWLENKYQDKCLKYIDLFANMSSNRLPFDNKQIQIRNTFDPDEITVRNPANKTSDEVTLLSVAYERPAHGFDRVINGLADYYEAGGTKPVKVIFAGKYLDSTKQLVVNRHMQKHCEFVPPVSGPELDRLYDNADLAIGHLANHRINSFSGSAIKTQEFLAKGIPFVYAWKETMLDDSFPYALKIELNEEPLDFEVILRFIDKMKKVGDTLVAQEMRTYFEKNAGWTVQFSEIL